MASPYESGGERFPGVSTGDLGELDQKDKDIRGRGDLPFWFDGVTADSPPAQMMFDLLDELQELDEREAQCDPNDYLPAELRRELGDARQRYTILADFHKEHRKLHKLGFPLEWSIILGHGMIDKGMQMGILQWAGYDWEKHQPFLDKIARAYNAFYDTQTQMAQPPEDLMGIPIVRGPDEAEYVLVPRGSFESDP